MLEFALVFLSQFRYILGHSKVRINCSYFPHTFQSHGRPATHLYVTDPIENHRKLNKSVKPALLMLVQCFSTGGKRLPGKTSRPAIWDLSIENEKFLQTLKPSGQCASHQFSNKGDGLCPRTIFKGSICFSRLSANL
jgi:hypothetical protein